MTESHRLHIFAAAEYVECGGGYVSDLFTAEGERKVDGALLRRVADAKLAAIAKDHTDRDGHAFTECSIDEVGAPDHLGRWYPDLGDCPVETGAALYVDRAGNCNVVAPVYRESDYEAWEAAQRAEAAAREADQFDAQDDDAEPEAAPGDECQAHAPGSAEAAPVAPQVDEEAVSRAPSRAMNRDAEAALTLAGGAAVALDFGVAFDAFLYTALVPYQAPLAIRAGIDGNGIGLPDELTAKVRAASNLWAFIDGMDEAEKRETFAAIIGATFRANTDQFAMDRPAPQDASREVAKRAGVDMHEAWSAEDRLAYIERMTKTDLVGAVLKLTGEEAAEAMKLGKAELVERAQAARWVPAYFAGIEGDTGQHVPAWAETVANVIAAE